MNAREGILVSAESFHVGLDFIRRLPANAEATMLRGDGSGRVQVVIGQLCLKETPALGHNMRHSKTRMGLRYL